MIRLASALALLLASCAGGETARAPEANGLGERPTIVSLNPCTDAILAELAAPEQLLAISHYSKDPRASSMEPEVAARYPATGGTVEEVLALDPDMVVASSFLAPATRTALADAGVLVETFGSASTVAESEAQIRALAGLTGNPDGGEALVERIGEALESAATTGPAVDAVLWQPGGIVPGESALISELLERTGFSGGAAARGLGQADYLSLEEVVADPPDVLLVAGSEAGQQHPVLDHLPQMRREAFDTRLIYCGGPTIIRAVERLVEIREHYPPARSSEEEGEKVALLESPFLFRGGGLGVVEGQE